VRIAFRIKVRVLDQHRRRRIGRLFCFRCLNWRYELNLLGHAPGVYFLSEAVGRWELSDGDRKLGHVEQAGLGFLFVPLQVIR
jgi:hypothetical protein